MGILNFLSKHIVDFGPKPLSVENTGIENQSDKMTKAEKERIRVLRVSTADMVQFSQIPYHLDCKIHHVVSSGAMPYAYMDLDPANIAIARSDLEKINQKLIEACSLSPKIPKKIKIPIDDIVFKPQKNSGHTTLICTPHTFTGKISKYPLSLSFMTNLDVGSNSTHGELFYGEDGKIRKAEVFCWRSNKGYFFYFGFDGQELNATKIEICNSSERFVVYKK